MIEQFQNLAKRKDFKPFSDKPIQQLVKPTRGNVRKIAKILSETEGQPEKQRAEYARMAGVKLSTDGEEITLPNTYTEFEALEEIALLLFDFERSDIADFDEMDEGEVNAGLAVFFMRRKGM